MSARETNLVRSLVRLAVDGARSLPLPERADVYEAAALVLHGPEADEASHTAVVLRQAEAAQLKFSSILQ